MNISRFVLETDYEELRASESWNEDIYARGLELGIQKADHDEWCMHVLENFHNEFFTEPDLLADRIAIPTLGLNQKNA